MENEKYEEYLHEYADMVLRLAFANVMNRADAEDIVQEVFIKLYKQKHFISNEHVKSWLIRVTINQCNSFHRKFFNKKRVDLELEWFADDYVSISIHEELALLPSHERVYVYLHYIEGYTYKEIGEMFHKSTSTIASIVTRALKNLRIQLQEE
ncbi:RNA polymerase sigma-70 factor (ECF subfamily) [Breznakia blatticola]|uniref:RNA polymerase sigma-70 factor (ECF subfamily) n=1 Tax=Breznakia blatticola TaxID=1754012 RepID=A0A4R7ZB74_9FIRM|nr:RNA polymerase sigma factor [Breznakia blatticola]TDW14753.1 RNA polymerase sigma-70 factor (ECF subfamily) [Breznakia blatticola]